MSSRPCFQLTAVAFAPPPAASIKMGEGVPWDLLPWFQLSSKPTGKTLLLVPRDQLATHSPG